MEDIAETIETTAEEAVTAEEAAAAETDAETQPAELTAEGEQPETGEPGKKKKRKRPKKDIFNFTKDIWYRGPLSYRHLKLLGWVCIVISQIAVVEGLKQRTYGIGNEFFLNRQTVDMISGAALPLLLISIFAFLLKKRDNYRNALIIYGSLTVGIAGLFLLIYERYILGCTEAFLHVSHAEAADYLHQYLYDLEDYKGFFAFNIFIDIFLCTLVMFFLDYTPKKFFTGKKLYIFRALVVLPMAYEVACIIVKVMASDHLISLPMWLSPFLTTKPPISLVMFLSIVRFIRIREKEFYETGRTPEQFRSYVATNRNSLRFSTHLIVIILVYSLIDLICLVFFTAIHFVIMNYPNIGEFTTEEAYLALERVYGWGFGGTASMADLIPIVLLFSYTKSHKIPLVDTAIPIVGFIAIAIVYIDSLFQIFMCSLDKINEKLLELLPYLVEV